MKFVQSLGSGTFGFVEQWYIGEENVALKRFEMRDIGLNYDCVREICILKSLKGNSNIIQCGQVFTNDVLFPERVQDDDDEIDAIHLELELFDCNLATFCDEVNFEQRCKIADRFLKDIVNALFVLHHYGLIHRDIKPENILVKNKDDLEEIQFCLSDFGGCRPLPNDDKERDNLGISREVYTNGYRPPEVVNDLKYSFSADIYALGMTLMYLCIRRTPQTPPVNDETLINYINNFDVPLHLTHQITSMCKHDPFLRPTSAHLLVVPIPYKLFRNASKRGDWTMGNNFLTLKRYYQLLSWAKNFCSSGSLFLLAIDTFDRLLCTFYEELHTDNIQLYMAACLLIVSKLNMYYPFKAKHLLVGMNATIFELAEKEFEVLCWLDWRITLPCELGPMQNIETTKVEFLIQHMKLTKKLPCKFSYGQMRKLIDKLDLDLQVEC